MSLRIRVLAVLSAVVVLPAINVAQAPLPSPLTFDAVSIKPNTTASGASRCCWEAGGLYAAINVTAESLIGGGYPSKVRELVGAPDWLSRERFDVTARAGFDPAPEERRRLVQALLTDRFKFAAHYRSEEHAVYSLELARSDRRLGPQLRALDITCNTFKPVGAAPQRLSYDEAPCTFRMSAGGETTTIVSGGRTMDGLADTLSGLVGRAVIDRTHLAGYYEFSLEYPGEVTQAPLFTALQEQLGLKLVSTRAPLDVLVIDHIEKPTED